MSLFGKLVPLTQPSTQIPPEVTAILRKAIGRCRFEIVELESYVLSS